MRSAVAETAGSPRPASASAFQRVAVLGAVVHAALLPITLRAVFDVARGY